MTTIKLDNLNPKQLQALIDSASAQMTAAQEKIITIAREKIEAVLSAHELSIEDVYPSVASRKAFGKLVRGKRKHAGGGRPPMYRNPDDHSQTWGGFGRKPLWYVKALKKRGATVESLLIPGAATSRSSTSVKVPRKKAIVRRGGRGRAKK